MKSVAVELFDARNRNVGLGEFTFKLAQGLASRADELRRDHGVELYFIVHKEFVGHFGDKVKYVVFTRSMRVLMRLYPKRFNLFHVTHQYCRLKTLYFAHKELLTIHDINFMYEKRGAKLDRYMQHFQKKLNFADVLNFISGFAQKDVNDNFKITQPQSVIYNGVTDLSKHTRADISGLDLPEGYLFHVSSIQPKKNVHLLVEMMRFMPEKHLVVAGSWNTKYGDTIKERIKELGLTNVTTLKNIGEDEKAALYASCGAFLFPSLCEGFGLPPMEAMCFGKPVFLSTLTSLPEVGGDVAYYWDELEPEVMAGVLSSGMRDFCADTQKAQRIIDHVRQFSWDRCAEGYIELYRKLV